MSPKGSSKRKIPCKTCGKKADFVKMYNDYFCTNCVRFENESLIKETKLPAIMKLDEYLFTAQKYAYIIYNNQSYKLGSCERRDLSKLVKNLDYPIRYYFFNDVNRIVGTTESKSMHAKGSDGTWKVYDTGRNFRGEIKFIAASDTWQALDQTGNIIAVRDSEDSRVALQTARRFTLVDNNDSENKLIQILRKNGFLLKRIDKEFDPYLAWSIIIAIHRVYYL
ncbi:MAG: hypothetical protein ACTSP7_05250 [Candidatus Heimdallarchaeota archaeon]